MYSIENSDQCLIGTAEIPVGGIHMDSILSESSLPLKYVAFSHCFRTEAGAAGAATRLLLISYLPVILFFSVFLLKNIFFLHIIYDDICYKKIIHIHVLQLSYVNYGVLYYPMMTYAIKR